MTIETKYNIDDNVWLMWENKPINCRVSFIEYRKTSKLKENEYLTYTCYITEKTKHGGTSSSPTHSRRINYTPQKKN